MRSYRGAGVEHSHGRSKCSDGGEGHRELKRLPVKARV